MFSCCISAHGVVWCTLYGSIVTSEHTLKLVVTLMHTDVCGCHASGRSCLWLFYYYALLSLVVMSVPAAMFDAVSVRCCLWSFCWHPYIVVTV